MPISWLVPEDFWRVSQTSSAIQREGIYDELRVRWEKKHVDLAGNTVTFQGNVVATYGPTVVYADEMELHMAEDHPFGMASGNVRLVDPDGTFHATKLAFYWRDGIANATNLEGQVHHLILAASQVDVDPKRWILKEVDTTPCMEATPVVRLTAKSLTVRPGRDGRATKPSLYLFGRKILTLPTYSFSLDRSAYGVRWPSIAYRRSEGLGISWQSALAVDSRTVFDGGFQAYRGRAFAGSFEVARNLMNDSPFQALPPRSDLSERFNYGYFDNIFVNSPDSEYGYLAAKRLTLAIGASANQFASARKSDARYSKPFETVLELSRPLGSGALFGQVRAQSIKEDAGRTRNRLVAEGIAVAKPIALTSSLSLTGRADSTAYLQPGGDFAWSSVQVGLTNRFGPRFNLGAALQLGHQFGSPLFLADPLYSLRSFELRGDLNLGPRRLSVISKYDLDSKKWFDHEISLRQVAGCFEPYVAWRKFPGSINFGLKLRLDDLYEALSQRKFRRATKPSAEPMLGH